MNEQHSHDEGDVGAAVVAAPQMGPGRRLLEAREQAGMTRAEVAGRLRLREELVAALEEDDYARLPPAAFVSGYLRSYARLLNLPIGEILASFGSSEQPPLVSTVKAPYQRRSTDLPVKLVSYGVVLLLVVLLSVWWFSQRPLDVLPSAEEAVVTPLLPGAAVELALPRTEEDRPPVADEPVAAPAAEATVNTEVAPSTDATAIPVVAAPAETPVQPVSAEKQTEVQLEARRDCWVEIKDAGGTRLMFDMLKAGATRTLRGKAPFDIFLGYAPGVTVYYQGKVFDHSAYIQKDVARFLLGKAGDNAPLPE